jgi:hypothetical protein
VARLEEGEEEEDAEEEEEAAEVPEEGRGRSIVSFPRVLTRLVRSMLMRPPGGSEGAAQAVSGDVVLECANHVHTDVVSGGVQQRRSG